MPSPPVRGRGLKPRKAQTPPAAAWSPPVRGRGLKQDDFRQIRSEVRSPPVRGRGLKRYFMPLFENGTLTSPPVRGRGLKPFDLSDEDDQRIVAPRAGARIET